MSPAYDLTPVRDALAADADAAPAQNAAAEPPATGEDVGDESKMDVTGDAPRAERRGRRARV